MKRFFQFFGLCVFVVFALGCSSYEGEASKLRQSWRTGNYEHAATVSGAALADADENDRLLWQLERATTLRVLGKRKESSDEFERAAETVKYWDEKPEVLLSQEALAGLTNLSALPYRGRGSDIIMLHTYRALSFLEQGNLDSARVALNSAYQAQSDAVERNAKTIENAQQEAKKSSVNVKDVMQRSGLNKALDAQDKKLSDVAVFADYVNPFTTWLYGIYFLHTGREGSDLERARFSLSRAAEMYPKNPYIEDDIELASRGISSNEILTYVIFESGLSPIVGLTRVDTMLPIPTGRNYFTPMPVSIALPKLVLSEERKYWGLFPLISGSYSTGTAIPAIAPALSANGIPAIEICDMNSIVRTDFDNAFPAILRRTLVTAILKSTAAAAVNAVGIEYAKRDGSVGSSLISLATIIGTSAYTYASSGADTRCWQTLPQNFSILRMKTPESRRIMISIGNRFCEVELLPGKVNLVFVKTTNEAGALIVSQSTLK